ncbi:hypothetical protein L1887_28193 [Cichorium endivia]|nr:hypothetical protein L1887_28193 [Cichorium endivia]
MFCDLQRFGDVVQHPVLKPHEYWTMHYTIFNVKIFTKVPKERMIGGPIRSRGSSRSSQASSGSRELDSYLDWNSLQPKLTKVLGTLYSSGHLSCIDMERVSGPESAGKAARNDP